MARKRGQYTITYKNKKFPKKVAIVSLGIGGLGFISLLVYKNWGFFTNMFTQGTTATSAGILPFQTAIPSSSYTGKFSAQSWLPYVFQYASLYGVSPALILGVISQESGGNPSLVSGSNAIGLMQITPPTAQTVLGKAVSPSLLTNPILNIEVGTAYLANLLRSFPTLAYALAAYNAGPSNASYYEHTLGYIPSNTAGDNVYSYVLNVINYANQALQSGAPGNTLSINSPSANATTVFAQQAAPSTLANNAGLSSQGNNLIAFEKSNTLNNLGFPSATAPSR